MIVPNVCGKVRRAVNAQGVLGEWVRERRERLGVSQIAFAARLGIPQDRLSYIERKATPGWIPDPEIVTALARELGVRLRTIYRAAGYPVDEEPGPETVASLHSLAALRETLEAAAIDEGERAMFAELLEIAERRRRLLETAGNAAPNANHEPE